LMLADERFVTGNYHTGTVERETDLSALEEPPAARPKAGEPEVVERTFEVEVEGKHLRVEIRERLDRLVRPRKPKPPKKMSAFGGGAGESLIAPMQGTIVKVLVKKGERVEAGDQICVLEAMKMENSILAHASGMVEELNVEAGRSVETGTILAVIR
jgi:acetyl-CoA/propionyl-CoA carboxylase biotin carboxyl carrier protein